MQRGTQRDTDMLTFVAGSASCALSHTGSAAICKLVACILHNMMVQAEETMQTCVYAKPCLPEETCT